MATIIRFAFITVLLCTSALMATAAVVPQILTFGPEEYVGAYGRLSDIATDTLDQPHIACDGGQNLYMYDRIDGTWRASSMSVAPYPQFYNPALEIDQNNRSWCSGILVAGLGFVIRENVHTANPGGPWLSGQNITPASWDCGNLSLDPGAPDYGVGFSSKGNWGRFVYDASQGGHIRRVSSGVLWAYNGGEKNTLYISKAGDVVHPAGEGTHAVWHAITDTGYQNSYRQAAGFPHVEWCNWNANPAIQNDGAYPTVVSDLVDPHTAYMAHGIDGIIVNIWQGNPDGSGHMLRASFDLLVVDAAGRSGLRRYAPQMAPAKNGGAFIVWTRGGQVILRWIDRDGTLGPETVVGNGTLANVTTDSRGNVHVVYNNGGIRYRKLTMAGTEGPATKTGDFDGDGLDDIAVFRRENATWFILKSSGGTMNINWGAPGDEPVQANYHGDAATEIAVFRPTTATWHIRGGSEVVFGLNGDVPVPCDYNGDTKVEFAVYRPTESRWIISGVTDMVFGVNGDHPEPADYDGDGKVDIGIFRPSNATWYYVSSKTRSTVTVPWGISTDTPVAADYDGDKKADIAVFRPENATWYIRKSGGGTESSAWGSVGDLPIPGKFTNTNKDEIAVFRPSTGQWFIRKASGSLYLGQAPVPWGAATDTPVPFKYGNDRTMRISRTDIVVYRAGWWYVRGAAMIHWGVAGDLPVPADYDGDRTIDLGVFRPSNGTWYYSSSKTHTTVTVPWGMATDKPVPADYNGDGKSEIAIYRPSHGGWYIRGKATANWGSATDIPMPDDYNSDGKADIAVFRPGDANWYINGVGTVKWGFVGDSIPIRADMDNDGKNDFCVFRPSNGTWYYWSSASNRLVTSQFGSRGDIPLTGDFDADGKTDKALFRSGDWYILQSSNGQLTPGLPPVWGTSSDTPIGGR